MSDTPPKQGDAQPESHGAQESGVHASVRYEPRDAWAGLVLWTLIGLAIVIVICGTVTWKLYGRWTKEEYGKENFPALMRQYTKALFPPPPRLQQSPGQPMTPQEELREMREQADHDLNSYGWVDQKAGIGRIPIAEAMKLLAAKHLGPKEEPHSQEPPNLSASR